MKYLTESRTTLVFEMPLGEVVTDFFDEMKSRTKGYASMEYSMIGCASRHAAVTLCNSGAVGDRGCHFRMMSASPWISHIRSSFRSIHRTLGWLGACSPGHRSGRGVRTTLVGLSDSDSVA